MTENKRFEIKPSAMYNNKYVIHDSRKEYTFPVLDSTLNYMFCKALNELHEENQVLEEQYADDCNEANSMTVKISELTEENEQLKRSVQYWYAEHKRIVNNYVDKIKEVEKENEQLKQHNTELMNKIDFLERVIDGDV